jgi:hypothetical protein
MRPSLGHLLCYTGNHPTLFTHIHVSYTSHCSHSTNINSSIGRYLEEDFTHKIAYLETRINEFKTEVKMALRDPESEMEKKVKMTSSKK